MIRIPYQLQQPEYRFYLIRKNKKIPAERGWTSKNNYAFNDLRLRNHIKQGNNYGLVCGYGDIVVIDFDDEAYYNEMKFQLPPTFKVITAIKRLPHMYYKLIDCPGNIKKMKVDDADGERLCDIQTTGCGVVAPGSCIDRKFYEPNDQIIREISLSRLRKIFNLGVPEEKVEYVPKENKANTNNKDISLAVLHNCNIETTATGNMKCPFHPMKGGGNLSVLDSGMIYCFHESTSWWPDQFISECLKISLDESKLIVELIKILYEEIRGGK